jgi:hypothetical protein
MELLLTTYDSALFNKIGFYVGQAIIAIQDNQPELLLEKYRNVPWNSRHQFSLTAKLTEILRQSNDWDTLINTLQGFLKVLLIPESFNSPILIKLIEDIRLLNPAKVELNGSNSLNTIKPVSSEIVTNGSLSQRKIAVLLLDAENLQINAETEQFLTTVCTCPIQVKIAFANWRSMGKLDIEFHQRGYDLIHVPVGKDHADGKMIAFGSSIHEHYPKAKEVFVCSSDTVMTNLCNHLQQNGLTVYRVSKQGNNITILNSKSGNKHTHSLLKLPSIEELNAQIKNIIISEEKRTSNQWFQLSEIAQIYYKKYNLNISEIVSYSLPGKTTKDIFLDKSKFVVHQLPNDNELYLALFEMSQLNKAVSNNDVENKEINTKADLEQALVNIITALAGKTSNRYIPIETLSANFNQQYGQGITNIFKKFDLNVKYITFLQSCDSFELEKRGDRWHVALRQASSVTD